MLWSEMCRILKEFLNPTTSNNNSEDTDDFADNFNNRNPATPRVNANEDKANNADVDLRRSTRTRRQPERYGHSVPSNIVT